MLKFTNDSIRSCLNFCPVHVRPFGPERSELDFGQEDGAQVRHDFRVDLQVGNRPDHLGSIAPTPNSVSFHEFGQNQNNLPRDYSV